MNFGIKKRMGELLVESGKLTKEQLQEAIRLQSGTGKRLGQMLVECGFVKEREILEIISNQLNIPYIDLSKYLINPQVAQIVPEGIAKKYNVVAIEKIDHTLKVVMNDPLDWVALEDLKLATNMQIDPVISTNKGIQDALTQVYSTSNTAQLMDQVEAELKAKARAYKEMAEREVLGAIENAPMVQLVNNIIEQAIARNASDIHFQPGEDRLNVRFRIDGQLVDIMKLAKESIGPITTRIKIMAELDIAERRLPQDGRITRQLGKEQLDLRVSIIPTILGEKTVIRLIYRTGMQFQVDALGFHPLDLEKILDVLKNPHGIILVTGPTGSGKSTTLTSVLRHLNQPNVNIITVEDPVENRIDNVAQIAVNPKVGLDFATALRSILRQDPDIIMIGEMRDAETSSIAIRAAITGHLVLSTLHTNDATSSISRLIDMGTESFMVATAIKGVVSQRLVRRICSECKTEHTVTAEEEKVYRIKEGYTVYKGTGCEFCNQTGYRGRLAIHEVFILSNTMQDHIAKGSMTSEQVRQEAVKEGMRTLWDNAYYNVLQGHTTMEEMLRVAYQQ